MLGIVNVEDPWGRFLKITFTELYLLDSCIDLTIFVVPEPD